jgi:hypothetical protein
MAYKLKCRTCIHSYPGWDTDWNFLDYFCSLYQSAYSSWSKVTIDLRIRCIDDGDKFEVNTWQS